MKTLTKEWIKKADADHTTAVRELRARRNPNYDAACFHSQQCTEKYLKATLQEKNIQFGKTHNLCSLLDLLVIDFPLFETLRSSLISLNSYAIDFRYPGESADKELASAAVKLCSMVRKEIRIALRLK